jgi:GNAT superfamily N-acetyltransferase
MNTIYDAPAPPAAAPVATTDHKRVLDILIYAFADDPVARWIFPSTCVYQHWFARLVRAFSGRAFDQGMAWMAPGQVGAALWLAPGVCPDDRAIESRIDQAVPARRQDEVFRMFGQMDTYHPVEPHWHLTLIGVLPEYRGRGAGSGLLDTALDQVDRRGDPVYLEATTDANARLYARYGFEAIGSIDAGPDARLTAMIRPGAVAPNA